MCVCVCVLLRQANWMCMKCVVLPRQAEMKMKENKVVAMMGWCANEKE